MTSERERASIQNRLEDQKVGTYLTMGAENDGIDGLVMIKNAAGTWRVADADYDASYTAGSVAGLLNSSKFPWSLS